MATPCKSARPPKRITKRINVRMNGDKKRINVRMNAFIACINTM